MGEHTAGLEPSSLLFWRPVPWLTVSPRQMPMLTPSARSPTVSPRPMPTPLATPTMSVSSLELTTDMAVSLAMELSVTVAMPAMEDTLDTVVSMVATVASMASVRPILSQRVTPMLTPSEPKADADAYTFDQIAYGLPQANAYATGHPHNVGVVTGVDYGHGRVSGYGAIGNRGYAGYVGYAGYAGVHGGYSGYRGAFYG